MVRVGGGSASVRVGRLHRAVAAPAKGERAMRWIFDAVTALLLAGSLAASPAHAKEDRSKEDGPDWKGTTETAHTVTWWCVDLNELWNVEVPVIVGAGTAIPPDPSPIPDPCTNPFPVTVPSGSAFTEGAAPVGWYTNTTYSSEIRAALESIGYEFHSQSPAEDFMSKMAEILVEVRNFADDGLVAEFSFDPRQNFRLVRVRDYFGQLPLDPVVIPELGLDLSSDAVGRLPLYGFPTIAGPVPPGKYRVWVWFRLTAQHNDGLGLADDNFFSAGLTLVARPPFIVLP